MPRFVRCALKRRIFPNFQIEKYYVGCREIRGYIWNTRIPWFIEQHLQYKSVPPGIWNTVRSLWMAPIPVFRFQNIMYVVDIFAVISEGSSLRMSTPRACIIEQNLKYKSIRSDIWFTVRGLWMARIDVFRFQNIMYVVEIFKFGGSLRFQRVKRRKTVSMVHWITLSIYVRSVWKLEHS